MARSPKMEEHIHAIRRFLLSKGWHPDRYGHLHKEITVKLDDGPKLRKYRMKFGKASLRYEVKASSQWVRLQSAPYDKVRMEGDKLHGLKR